VLSRTMKQATVPSTVHGGGKRRSLGFHFTKQSPNFPGRGSDVSLGFRVLRPDTPVGRAAP